MKMLLRRKRNSSQNEDYATTIYLHAHEKNKISVHISRKNICLQMKRTCSNIFEEVVWITFSWSCKSVILRA